MTTAFTPVKIGVIGLGAFGKLHAQTLAGLAEADLVALVARRQASLDETNMLLPGRDMAVPGYLDLHEAINASDAQAWIVASSSASHVPITKVLLEAGKTVLLEKPIAEDLEQAQSLAPLVADDSSNLMLGHILIFNSEIRVLMEQVNQRGQLTYINCVRHRPTTAVANYPGESPLYLTMVHDLYMTLALTHGDPGKRFWAKFAKRGTEPCDLTIAHIEFESGLLASFSASFLTTPGMGDDGFDRLEVFGKGWAARLEPNPRPIIVWDDMNHFPMNLEIIADPNAPAGMLAEQLRCFCRVVRGMQRVPIGARYEDAITVQQWCEAFERSAVE